MRPGKRIWLIDMGDAVVWCNRPDPEDGVEVIGEYVLQDNAMSEKVRSVNLEDFRKMADHLDCKHLRGEAYLIRAAIRELTTLRAENARLRGPGMSENQYYKITPGDCAPYIAKGTREVAEWIKESDFGTVNHVEKIKMTDELYEELKEYFGP